MRCLRLVCASSAAFALLAFTDSSAAAARTALVPPCSPRAARAGPGPTPPSRAHPAGPGQYFGLVRPQLTPQWTRRAAIPDLSDGSAEQLRDKGARRLADGAGRGLGHP